MKRMSAVILATAIVFTSMLSPVSAMAADEAKSDYPVLAEFTAQTVEGEELTQDILEESDITLLYFWATYCGYCVDEMPDIAEFIEGMPSNVQMFSICGDGMRNQDLVNQIQEKTGFEVPTIIDADQDMLKLFAQTIYTPTLYVVDKEGNIVLEPLVGAPKDLDAVYSEILDQAFEKLEIEPVYEEDAGEEAEASENN